MGKKRGRERKKEKKIDVEGAYGLAGGP